jgi:hypothetical protein
MNYYLTLKNNNNIKIINNDTENNFLYVINYFLNNNIISIKNKSLLITESNIFPNEKIKFKKKLNISMFLYKKNILNMFYIENYKIVDLENIINNETKYNKYNLKSIDNLNNDNNIKIINDEKIFKNNIDNDEINWYKYIYNIKNIYENINFIPLIYETYDYGYLMEYKKNYIPLNTYIQNNIQYNIQNNIENLDYFDNILNKLNVLHKSYIIKEDKKIFLNNLKIEIHDNIIKNNINNINIINFFEKIEYVNDVKIDNIDNILEKCKNIITQYYNTLDIYEYSIIFGNCNFSNILINNEDIIFINPRGYFGNTKIFGPIEYDYANLLYSLYGCDNINDKTLIFDKNENKINILIENVDIYKKIISKYFNKLHFAYMIIIIFSMIEKNKNNIINCITYYYYGLFLGTTKL